MKLLSFDEWFNISSNMDLRMPFTCKLSFRDKLTIQEWQEFIKYIYEKCKEARSIK